MANSALIHRRAVCHQRGQHRFFDAGPSEAGALTRLGGPLTGQSSRRSPAPDAGEKRSKVRNAGVTKRQAQGPGGSRLPTGPPTPVEKRQAAGRSQAPPHLADLIVLTNREPPSPWQGLAHHLCHTNARNSAPLTLHPLGGCEIGVQLCATRLRTGGLDPSGGRRIHVPRALVALPCRPRDRTTVRTMVPASDRTVVRTTVFQGHRRPTGAGRDQQTLDDAQLGDLTVIYI